MAVVTFPPVVRVVWTEPAPQPDSEWVALAAVAATKTRVCDAVGFLVLDTPSRIAVATAVDPAEGQARGVVVIPRAALADDIVTLKPSEEVED